MRQRINRPSPSGRHLTDQPYTLVTSATMAGPFLPPQIVLDGFKERPEALAMQGSLFFGAQLFSSDRETCRR